MKPDWVIEAERHIGLSEIPGGKHNATIQSWLRNLRAWWDDDETPWCELIRYSDGGVSEHAFIKYGFGARAYQVFRWWGIGTP